MRNHKISAKARSSHFRYKAAPLIVATGRAEVDINTIDITAGLSFSTKTLESGQVVPHVTSADIKVQMNRFDIKIHLHGNLITDIGSLFEVFFVGTVAGDIEDQLT